MKNPRYTILGLALLLTATGCGEPPPEPECETTDACPEGGKYNVQGKVASDCTFTTTATPKNAGDPPPAATGATAYDGNGNPTDHDSQTGGTAMCDYDSDTGTLVGTVGYIEGNNVVIDSVYFTPKNK